MVIRKKNTSQKKDQNYFMFAMPLSLHLFSDYIALKLNYHLEPLTLAPTNLVSMVEVIEKSLKLFLAFYEKPENALSHYSENYGHNLEKLRRKAATFNHLFDSEEIKNITAPFDDRRGALYQNLRYGTEKTIEGFSTNLNNLIPIVETIFFTCIMSLEENYKKAVNSSSFLYMLINNNECDQSQNKELLLSAVKFNNPYYADYAEYCLAVDTENKKFIKLIREQESKNHK